MRKCATLDVASPTTIACLKHSNFLNTVRHKIWITQLLFKWNPSPLRTSTADSFSHIECHVFLRKTCRDNICLVQKSCHVYFSVMHYTPGESGEETIWSQTLKNWTRWTHQNSTPDGSMQRKCWRRWKVTIFKKKKSQSQMEQQSLWRRSTSENIHLNLGSSRTRRGTRYLLGEPDGSSSPTPLQEDSTRDDEEAKSDIWTTTGGTQSQTVHAERRSISFSVELHRRCQNNTYITGCYDGETYWWLLERGFRRIIIRCMDRIHKIRSTEGKTTRRVHMVWSRLTRKQTT